MREAFKFTLTPFALFALFTIFAIITLKRFARFTIIVASDRECNHCMVNIIITYNIKLYGL